MSKVRKAQFSLCIERVMRFLLSHLTASKRGRCPSLHGGGFCGLPPSLHHPNDEDLSLGTPEKVARMGHGRSVSACGVPSPVRQEKPCRTWGTRRQDMMMGSHETVLGFWTAARHSGSCRGADPPRPKAVGLC